MKIKFVEEIPQWIIGSDVGAYVPKFNTIYVRKDKWWILFHELGHWLGWKLGGKNHWINNWLDRIKMKIVINDLLVREVYRGVGIKKDGYENIEVKILIVHKGLELDYGGKVYSLINDKVILHEN